CLMLFLLMSLVLNAPLTNGNLHNFDTFRLTKGNLKHFYHHLQHHHIIIPLWCYPLGSKPRAPAWVKALSFIFLRWLNSRTKTNNSSSNLFAITGYIQFLTILLRSHLSKHPFTSINTKLIPLDYVVVYSGYTVFINDNIVVLTINNINYFLKYVFCSSLARARVLVGVT